MSAWALHRNLPYGIVSNSSLSDNVMGTYSHLDNGSMTLLSGVMRPLALKQLDEPQRDLARHLHFISSFFLYHKWLSSHQPDDDDDDVMSKLLEQVLHLLPPILTLLIHSTRETDQSMFNMLNSAFNLVKVGSSRDVILLNWNDMLENWISCLVAVKYISDPIIGGLIDWLASKIRS
ncbi:hypothetical protein Tco_0811962 [Tanacetum coccineum]